MTTKIQLRRGPASLWTSQNPTLADGEVGFENDTSKFKIGDGSTAWNSLTYASVLPSQLSTLAVTSFNTRHGAITLTDSDVNTALGYTAANASDLSSLGSQTSTDISDAITTAENYADGLIATEVTDRNNAIASNLVVAKGYTDTQISDITTSTVTEGSNKYFTAARAVTAVTNVLNGHTGIDINTSSGIVITNTGVTYLDVDQQQLKLTAHSGSITF